MKPTRLLTLASTLFLVFVSVKMAAGNDNNDALSPEKAELIYKTLIPAEKTPTKEKPAAPAVTAEKTDQQIERVSEMMHKHNIKLLGQPGLWEFEYQGRQIFLLIDTSAGLVSLTTPVVGLDQLSAKPNFDEAQFFEKLLKANYLMTQETRFALNHNIVWLTYVHPVDSLVEQDISRALDRLVKTASQALEST